MGFESSTLQANSSTTHWATTSNWHKEVFWHWKDSWFIWLEKNKCLCFCDMPQITSFILMVWPAAVFWVWWMVFLLPDCDKQSLLMRTTYRSHLLFQLKGNHRWPITSRYITAGVPNPWRCLTTNSVWHTLQRPRYVSQCYCLIPVWLLGLARALEHKEAWKCWCGWAKAGRQAWNIPDSMEESCANSAFSKEYPLILTRFLILSPIWPI